MRKETTEEDGTVVYMDSNETCYAPIMLSIDDIPKLNKPLLNLIGATKEERERLFNLAYAMQPKESK